MRTNFLRLSPTARYALQGLVHLASAKAQGAYCLARHSAKTRQLPKDFLAKIFQRLARHGILISRRGPGGGYSLAREPEEITLAEILTCLEEHPGDRFWCSLEERECNPEKPCLLHEAIAQANRILSNTWEKTSLADLAREESHESLE